MAISNYVSVSSVLVASQTSLGVLYGRVLGHLKDRIMKVFVFIVPTQHEPQKLSYIDLFYNFYTQEMFLSLLQSMLVYLSKSMKKDQGAIL